MYMALGVKAGQEEAGGVAAGDVVVGWINTATGQVQTPSQQWVT